MRPVTALSPEGDDLLIARAARGDRPALDELFRRYRDTAYRVAYRLLGHSDDAWTRSRRVHQRPRTRWVRAVHVQDVAPEGG